MALDGIAISCLTYELNQEIINTKISKIAQPEPDAILLTLKGSNGQRRLLISASASLPLMYLIDENKPSPATAPNFCMLLRKHIANGRITGISQPEMERIINIEIEHLNELGDLCKKTLIIELMGKRSNIIFCDEKGMIIDSIKHISAQVSSFREVLPGRDYFIPRTTDKKNPLFADQNSFLEEAGSLPLSASKAIYSTYTGISPIIASEICHRASVDADLPLAGLAPEQKLHLANNFCWMMDDIRSNKFSPSIYYHGKEPVDFSAVTLHIYDDFDESTDTSISTILKDFYAKKDAYTRIRQKSAVLRRITSTALERSSKKYTLQCRQLKDTEKRDKYKIYGELLNTYGYQATEGVDHLKALNYYTNEMISIPLDKDLTPNQNAQKYFARYNKLKRTYEALTGQIAETSAENAHLESILSSLDIAENEDDLLQIRAELAGSGYIHQTHSSKKIKFKSKPFHYLSSDGFDIYIGKNNFQNDELTFKFANGGDWWFHAKGIPGSHVVVRTEGRELPDRVFEEAGALAGFYSKARDNDKVEIDYLERKNVKKPNGSAPGFVVYYTNYSLTITPDISNLKKIE